MNSLKDLINLPWFQKKLSDFNFIPGSPYIYWISPKILDLFKKYPSLDKDRAFSDNEIKIADCVKGVDTGDDVQFVRYYWEVLPEHINARWRIYAGKGQKKKYYRDILQVVDWEDNARKIKEHPSGRYQNEKYIFQDVPGIT